MDGDFLKHELTPRGKHCYIVNHPLDKRLVLKIFDFQESDTWQDFMWGDPPKKGHPRMNVLMTEATFIQNICWLYGLAPRVYGIITVEVGGKKYVAQEVQKAVGFCEDMKEAFDVYRKVKELGEVYGFGNEKDDVSLGDVVGGMLIDFNTFHFKGGYKEKIAKQYVDMCRYGKIYYHNFPELGLVNGPRDNKKREQYMLLNGIEFDDKSVLDLGCAGGYFCRYASDRGATDIMGIDYPDVIGSNPVMGAYIASFYLAYNDIDYQSINLIEQKPNKADIVFFLSMNYHIGIPSWIADVTNEVCIFEDNSRERNAKAVLEKMFHKVVKVGVARDHGNKPIYHCYK